MVTANRVADGAVVYRQADGGWVTDLNAAAVATDAEVAHQLIDFFKARGPYSAYLVGGGDWDWRKDPEWQKIVFRFDA